MCTCIGLVLERASLREVLAEAKQVYSSCDPPTWCGEATTLCAGKETPLGEKLNSEDGAVGDASRETVAVALSW